MVHTTTKATRTQRVDSRPNGKKRSKTNKLLESHKTIQDLRVTRKLKSEKVKEQMTPKDESFKRSNPLVGNEKVLRALRKKLKAIECLLEKQRAGDVLDSQQLSKVDSLSSVLEDMEQLVSSGNKRLREQDADEEEGMEEETNEEEIEEEYPDEEGDPEEEEEEEKIVVQVPKKSLKKKSKKSKSA